MKRACSAMLSRIGRFRSAIGEAGAKELLKATVDTTVTAQAVEPAITHLKRDNVMDRCWLKGQTGDALHAVPCAAGYSIHWLLRAIVCLGLKGPFAPVLAVLIWLQIMLAVVLTAEKSGEPGLAGAGK